MIAGEPPAPSINQQPLVPPIPSGGAGGPLVLPVDPQYTTLGSPVQLIVSLIQPEIAETGSVPLSN